MTEHIQYSPEKDALVLLDQRYLPTREEWFVCKTVNCICEALVVMVVRGAPAIGAAAAFGLALAGFESASSSSRELVADYQIVAPTEWNFHPQGRLRDWLRGFPATDDASLRQCVAHAVAALDPCVGWELDVRRAEPMASS